MVGSNHPFRAYSSTLCAQPVPMASHDTGSGAEYQAGYQFGILSAFADGIASISPTAIQEHLIA